MIRISEKENGQTTLEFPATELNAEPNLYPENRNEFVKLNGNFLKKIYSIGDDPFGDLKNATTLTKHC